MRSGGIELLNLDCLDLLKSLPDASVDLMLTDPPYATTQNGWDKPINLAEMWLEWERVVKPNGAFVFTASQPFTSHLVISRQGFFKYELIWNKKRPTGHLNADIMPLRQHENIIVFGRGKITYNPQFTQDKLDRNFKGQTMKPQTENYGKQKNYVSDLDPNKSYPRSVIACTAVIGNSVDKMDHPTQKPLDLFRWLVRTYSNPGETVFDGYSGSGTTAEACIIEGRKFIGSETKKEYFDDSIKRISNALSKPQLVFP